ncbi:hypothetical protein K0M31_015743, partial [Melipona bicolor]
MRNNQHQRRKEKLWVWEEFLRNRSILRNLARRTEDEGTKSQQGDNVVSNHRKPGRT